LKVINSGGCDNAGHITITVKNAIALEAKFVSPEFICRSFDSAFFANESTGKIVHWNWDFGNGHTDTIEKPAMQYFSTGNGISAYNIKLTVIDTAGCTDTMTRLLRIADNCFIAVPTAFTPNNDGLNDYLYPLNAYKATHLFFKVYNRKGQLMFETNDWTKKWDGVFRGAPQDPGTYIWTLQYNDEQNKLISLKGTTVLLR